MLFVYQIYFKSISNSPAIPAQIRILLYTNWVREIVPEQKLSLYGVRSSKTYSTMFRILLVVSIIVGFILCFLSMVLPYWVIFETATYSGQIGVFLICINQHDGVSCSRIMKDSYIVDGNFSQLHKFKYMIIKNIHLIGIIFFFFF